MTQTVSVDEAQDKLQDLLAQALAGDEVIITERGTPVARLVPVVAHSKKKRVAGLNRGTISTSEDFYVPLPDEFWLGQALTNYAIQHAGMDADLDSNLEAAATEHLLPQNSEQ